MLSVERAPQTWLTAPWELRRDGEPVGVPVPDESVMVQLVAEIDRIALVDGRSRFIPVRAAAVAHGGRAVLIAGGHRTGKSTLAASLVRQGWGYISDAVSFIDVDGRLELRPYWRPFTSAGLTPIPASELGVLAGPTPLAASRDRPPAGRPWRGGAGVARRRARPADGPPSRCWRTPGPASTSSCPWHRPCRRGSSRSRTRLRPTPSPRSSAVRREPVPLPTRPSTPSSSSPRSSSSTGAMPPSSGSTPRPRRSGCSSTVRPHRPSIAAELAEIVGLPADVLAPDVEAAVADFAAQGLLAGTARAALTRRTCPRSRTSTDRSCSLDRPTLEAARRYRPVWAGTINLDVDGWLVGVEYDTAETAAAIEARCRRWLSDDHRPIEAAFGIRTAPVGLRRRRIGLVHYGTAVRQRTPDLSSAVDVLAAILADRSATARRATGRRAVPRVRQRLPRRARRLAPTRSTSTIVRCASAESSRCRRGEAIVDRSDGGRVVGADADLVGIVIGRPLPATTADDAPASSLVDVRRRPGRLGRRPRPARRLPAGVERGRRARDPPLAGAMTGSGRPPGTTPPRHGVRPGLGAEPSPSRLGCSAGPDPAGSNPSTAPCASPSSSSTSRRPGS